MPEEKILNAVEEEKTPAIDYNKDIHNVSLEDMFNEGADEEEAIIEPTNTKDEKKEPEVVIEEKKIEQETKPTKEDIQLDAEKLKEEISDATAKKIVEALAPEDTTKQEKKDLLEDAPWNKEKREPTWEEALKYMADQNKKDPDLRESIKQDILKELNQEVQTEEVKEREQAETAAKEEKQRQESWNAEWDRQVKVLEASGKISKIANPQDPKDPGRMERVALFEALKQMSDEQTKNGQPVSLSLIEAYTTTYKNPNEQAGKDAPVNGSRRSVAAVDNTDLDYNKDVRGKTLDQIMRGE